MKRKETLLESNLIYLGFRLVGKTYTGKHSDKVEGYHYEKEVGETTYVVNLDKTREEIVSFLFRNPHFYEFDLGKINGLYDVFNQFTLELQKIYNFSDKKALSIYNFIVEEENINDPFVEESNFDD